MRHATFFVAAGLLLAPGAVQAQGLAGKAAREFGELLTKKLGRRAAGEAAERIPGRIAREATRHADDLGRIVMKQAGSLADDAGRATLKAAGRLGTRNGRRLAMMAESSELKAIGRTPELMGVIERHGDRAMDFIWRHKGSLAVGTTLAAFLTNPEPFIDGTREITGTVAEHAVKPAVVAAGGVSRSAVDTAGWVLVILAGGIAAAVYQAARHGTLAKAGVETAFALFKRK